MTAALLALALAQGDLKAVLAKLGEETRRRETAAACTYHEVTTVEELDPDGKVKGSEVRTYDAEVKGVEVTRRDQVEVTKSGAQLAALLTQPPKGAKGRKPAKSPFHPDAQAQYRFGLAGNVVTIEPLKADPERPRGTAKLDGEGRIVELEVSPSKAPMLLEALSLRFVFAETACGRQAVEIDTEGRGLPMLVDTRFRTRTRLSEHRRAAKK